MSEFGRAANLMAVLEEEPPNGYDVISAADVLIYVGKLDSLVSAVSRTLRPGGMFAFSVEAAECSPNTTADGGTLGYWLTPTGRYAHTLEYLRNLARCNDFEINLMRQVRLRTERRRPVMGSLSVWTASGRSPPIRTP
jgi:predicted TPR repeat methyltransferase